MASKKMSSPDSWYDGGEDYDNPDTGSDPSKWDEKTVGDCPQRGRQPKLSLSPEGDDFYTGSTFNEKLNASSCMEDFKDLPRNPLNEPVKVRTKDLPLTGWETVASDVTPTGSSNSGKSTPGGEKR